VNARALLTAVATVIPLTATASAPYFPPLAKGDSWAYAVEQGPADKTPTLTLNGVEVRKKSKGQLVFGSFDPRNARDKRSLDVMHTVDVNACVADPFTGAILRQGARCEQAPAVDEVWRGDLKIDQRTLQIETTFKGREEITVGAGKFNALKFVCSGAFLNSEGQKFALLEITYWYAAEAKGLVKIDSRATMRDGVQLFTASLESFPAK